MWKRISNEVQYNFNEFVNYRVEGALSVLAKRNLEAVKSELEEDLPTQHSVLEPVLLAGLSGRYPGQSARPN